VIRSALFTLVAAGLAFLTSGRRRGAARHGRFRDSLEMARQLI
jgi:hypothetical protein